MARRKICVGAIIGGLAIGLTVEIAGAFAADFFRWLVIELAVIGVVAVIVAAIFSWPREKPKAHRVGELNRLREEERE